MSTFKKTLIILFVTMGLASCDVVNQVAQIANFANCTFNFNSVNKIQMLGIDLRKGMTKMDYIITLNGKQVVSTTLNNAVNVPANSSNVVSIPVTTDLFQLFSGESADAIVNLAFKLAGASSNPVNVGIKVKPYIKIGDKQLPYPEYITMNKTLQ